ncbi:MAG TPA: contractile injection system protein, VgrG/Pvc8 family [Lysobacter sp.]
MPAIPTPSDRSFSCAVLVNGEAAGSLLHCIQSVTVDEDLDVGSSCAIELEACRNDDGSWPYLADRNLQVWNRVTVYAAFPKRAELVFDGYISQMSARTNEEAANMTVQILGVDASYHMNQEEKTRIWRGKTYEAIATEIFKEYDFKPIVADPPGTGEAPPQVAQRSTDHRFLRELARRRGYEFYVLGANAYFRPAVLTGQPQKLIAVNFGDQTNCHHLQFDSDGTAPTEAQVSYFDAMEGSAASDLATQSGLAPLGMQPLSELRGAIQMPQARRIARGLGFHSGAQATEYAAGMLRRHGWWVTARGTLNGLRYGTVLRTRKLVTVKGAGTNHNGNYYVRKVQHRLTARSYDMQFELARNALGQLGSENFEGESPDALVPAAAGAGVDDDPIEVTPGGPRVLPA